MRNARPLLIALPAFLLGGVACATLTTAARAQLPVKAEDLPVYGGGKATVRSALPDEYRVVRTEAELNALAARGFEYVGQSSAAAASTTTTISFTTYTVRRRR